MKSTKASVVKPAESGKNVVKPMKKLEEQKQSEIKEEVYNGGECNICMNIMVEPI